MYCNNCGKNNPEGSKFCQHCGIKLDKKRVITPVEHQEKTSTEEGISSNTPPYPYVISTAKLIVLSRNNKILGAAEKVITFKKKSALDGQEIQAIKDISKNFKIFDAGVSCGICAD